MATITTLAGTPRPEHRGLTFWMERSDSELQKVRNTPDPDAVHDLRVALRRCRSVASVMEEVDPHPAWPELREMTRKLFRSLGALRDEQVMHDWVKTLAPETDSVGLHLLAALDSREPGLREMAKRGAAKFDLKAWRQLERVLRQRSRFVPAGSLAAGCVALERLEEAQELHARAMRTENPKAWHVLRIGLKRFRYTVESLLPEQHAAWSESLKRVQDLLGDIHDLDVLTGRVEKSDAVESEDSLRQWHECITSERQKRMETYCQLMLGKTSLWNTWRAGLPTNGRVEIAVQAKLRATGRASDSNWRRTSQITRISSSIFEAFKRAGAGLAFENARLQKMLTAAATLHGVGGREGNEKSPQKIAHKFIQKLPLPPAWSFEEWETLACVVRYHRGAEPSDKRGPYSKLPAARQTEVRALAGILRLARALRKSGIEKGSGFRAEKTSEALILRVPGLPDDVDSATRIAKAKHLLEQVLAIPVIVKAVQKLGKIVALPSQTISEYRFPSA
jgi:CHAD domain-containing protein